MYKYTGILFIDTIRSLFGSESEDSEKSKEEDTDKGKENDDSNEQRMTEGKRVDQLEANFKDLKGEVSDLENEVQRSKSDIEEVTESVENLDDRTTELLDIYDSFQARVNPLVSGNISQLPSHEKRVQSQERLHEEEEDNKKEKDRGVENLEDEDLGSSKGQVLDKFKQDEEESNDMEKSENENKGNNEFEIRVHEMSQENRFEYLQWLVSRYGLDISDRHIDELEEYGYISSSLCEKMKDSLNEFNPRDHTSEEIDYEESLSRLVKLGK